MDLLNDPPSIAENRLKVRKQHRSRENSREPSELCDRLVAEAMTG